VTTKEKPGDIDAWLQALGDPSADRDYKPGHERVQKLIFALEQLGHCFVKPKLRVRVAGTNGKGSTSHFLAAALQVNDCKVGLYTSPHILSFHERMRIDGKPISQAELLDLMALVMPLALEIGTSYFETATVLALLYFSQQQVDVEILEAGVGAKLDATTAVFADVGLLTPIGLDHQAWLGNTLEEITQEKYYVFQGCKIQISAPQGEVVMGVLSQYVGNLAYAQLFPEELSVIGKHQKTNAGLAYAAVQMIAKQCLPMHLNKSKRAIGNLHIQGRMQCIQHGKHTFYLDAAHNEHAVQALLPTLSGMQPQFDVIIVCTREDRNLSDCLPWLEKMTDKIIGMTGDDTYQYPTIGEALTVETQAIKAGKFLILGSFVTLGKVLAWMDKDEF